MCPCFYFGCFISTIDTGASLLKRHNFSMTRKVFPQLGWFKALKGDLDYQHKPSIDINYPKLYMTRWGLIITKYWDMSIFMQLSIMFEVVFWCPENNISLFAMTQCMICTQAATFLFTMTLMFFAHTHSNEATPISLTRGFSACADGYSL